MNAFEYLVVAALVIAGAGYAGNKAKEAIEEVSDQVATDIRSSVKHKPVEAKPVEQKHVATDVNEYSFAQLTP